MQQSCRSEEVAEGELQIRGLLRKLLRGTANQRRSLKGLLGGFAGRLLRGAVAADKIIEQ